MVPAVKMVSLKADCIVEKVIITALGKHILWLHFLLHFGVFGEQGAESCFKA